MNNLERFVLSNRLDFISKEVNKMNEKAKRSRNDREKIETLAIIQGIEKALDILAIKQMIK